ncbi:MAG TPA: hypothetical protein VFL03_14195 [Candidatus Limnocylindrales bacterium]|nr:hypothetical protein [Candidatus Limnocylindrales bacterium]
MTGDGQLHHAEAAYLAARSARDRLDVARARGVPAHADELEHAARRTMSEAQAALDAVDSGGLTEEDRAALTTMRDGLATAASYALPGVEARDEEAAVGTGAAADPIEYTRRQRLLEASFTAAAGSLGFEGQPVTRLELLARLAQEPDPARRRALIRALEPLWRSVDGDGGPESPYRGLIEASRERWRRGRSPIEANARALGVTADDVVAWATTALEGWRRAFVEPARTRREPPVEPWDWWWHAGEAQRRLTAEIPLDALEPVNRAFHASLGADLDELGVVFDIHPRADRPTVPVAYTTFGERPHRRPDGTWHPGRPTVLESLTGGGLGELAELVHETGHAIHIAGIRTRPAFADWPDSDALTEALGDLVAVDVHDPRWQRRWLPGGVSIADDVALRGRFADTALDAAWALFEIRLHEAPERSPNDVWADITSEWLGIARHPEWSWWAIRGQLVEEPGYMANYAIGAVLAADLRAAIRRDRGEWIDGDGGWYAWVREHVYRFGLERASRDVLRDVLGRPPSADALVAELAGPAGR